MNKEMHEVPLRNCDNCPFVSTLAQGILMQRAHQQNIINHTLSDEIDEQIAPNIAEILSEAPDEFDVPTEIDDIASILRKNIALTIDQIDILIQSKTSLIDKQTRDCPGPLKMRAEKAGMLVTATVCCSPRNLPGLNFQEICRVERNYSDDD